MEITAFGFLDPQNPVIATKISVSNDKGAIQRNAAAILDAILDIKTMTPTWK